jgi:hypothetical protein
VVAALCEGFDGIQEIRFCFFVSINNSLSWILRKLLVFYNKLMQIVTKEVGTGVSSMAIKHPEKAAFGPIINIFFRWWLHYIQNYAYSIFVVVSDDTLIGVGSVAHDESILSHAAFSWLPTGQV